MAVVSLAGGGSGNTGALAADNVFYVDTGKVQLSSDAGTTKVPFDAGEKVVFSAGLTVHYYNDQPIAAQLRHMPL